MIEKLNSLRMRAESAGRHISGAERLIPQRDLEAAALEMLQRALQHHRGQAEKIHIQVEQVPGREIVTGKLPDLHNNMVDSWQAGRELATQLLGRAGVSPQAVECSMTVLANGAAPDGNSMRGAMLIDAVTGDRLEADCSRGVRVSRMDLTPAAREQLLARLDMYGLANSHVLEALTLAAKVVMAPGVLAELCWSDDPDYLAGYVASPVLGYQRISLLKPSGEERGGRAFFVNPSTYLPELYDWLETRPVLFEQVGDVFV